MGDSSGRAVQGMGLRPLACSDCGFESHRVHGCVSLDSVVSCQVEALRQADHSSRAIPVSVVCLSVVVQPR